MRSTMKRGRFGAIGFVLLACACSRPPETGETILEDTSSHSLGVETGKAAEAVKGALDVLDTDPAAAADLLLTAEESLDNLLDFFIPLHEAREHAFNAYRHFSLGETTLAEKELDQTEGHLRAIVEAGDKQMLREMEPALEMVADARLAIGHDPAEASKYLRELANRLNSMVARGGLVVD